MGAEFWVLSVECWVVGYLFWDVLTIFVIMLIIESMSFNNLSVF